MGRINKVIRKKKKKGLAKKGRKMVVKGENSEAQNAGREKFRLEKRSEQKIKRDSRHQGVTSTKGAMEVTRNRRLNAITAVTD